MYDIESRAPLLKFLEIIPVNKNKDCISATYNEMKGIELSERDT